MKRRLKLLTSFSIILLLIAVGYFLVSNKKAELEKVPRYGSSPTPVTVSTAEKGEMLKKNNYLALLKPGYEANISSRVTAKVKKIKVEEGEKVKAGQELVQLECNDLKEKLKSQKAKIEEAEAELAGKKATVNSLKEVYEYWEKEENRNQYLAEKGAVSESKAEEMYQHSARTIGDYKSAQKKARAIEKRIKSLRAQKEEIKANLDYHTISSPLSGIVSNRLVDPGDLASPSKNLINIQNKNEVKLIFDIPQEDLPEISEGENVIYEINGEKHSAEITVLHPSLKKSRMKRAEVWIKKQNMNLSVGSYLPISVITKEIQDSILVPNSSIVPSPRGENYIFIVKNSHLQAKPIDILGINEEKAAIKGISEGTQVVKSDFLGWNRLSSGEKVETINESN